MNLDGSTIDMAGGQLDQFLRNYRQDPTAWATQGQSDAQLLKRFADHRDETAFEALVKRFGPMVLGVCRRVLHDPNDAEDAFQATFLVLVRKAGAIAKPDLLGNWLYGVANRVAVKARANSARRSAHERQAASMPKAESTPETANRELRAVLDEEISRLPEKYRAPLVLCYLEGKTNEQAARQLGCPAGSMSWRLARGRELLRQRLSRRQLAFTPMMFPPLLAHHTAQAAVPSTLLHSTVHTGVAFAKAGAAAAATTSATVNQLVQETLRALTLAQAKRIAGLSASVFLAFLLLYSGAYAISLLFGGDGPPMPALKCLPPWHGP
jgi:RNA polymerase sigma factor (sigma-70 family)